jgi:hypothetical protein
MFTMPRFALTLLLSSMVAVQGRLFTPARQLGKQVFDNDEFSVEITGNGNVPKYTFFSKANPEYKYKCMFQKLFESKEGSKVGPTISLPSLDWTFSTFDDETAFWINGTGSDKFSKVAFRNVLQDESIKFDVIIEGFQFSDDADALNLIWKMSNSTGGADDFKTSFEESLDDGEVVSESTDTELCYYGANGKSDTQVCFTIVDTATATVDEEDPKEVAVSVSLDDAEGGFKLQYARFEGDLFHDPSLGFGLVNIDLDFGFFGNILDSFQNMFNSLWNSMFGWWNWN